MGQAQWERGWYGFLTLHTHGDFVIVLPAPWPVIRLFHYPDTEPTSPCPILIMLSAMLGSKSINLKVIVLTRPGLEHCEVQIWTSRLRISPIFHNWRQSLYSCGHPDWCITSQNAPTGRLYVSIVQGWKWCRGKNAEIKPKLLHWPSLMTLDVAKT